MTKPLYTAHATSKNGRDGQVATDDKKLDFKLGRPGSTDAGTNPEQLFACGYSACFGSAIKAVAGSKKLAVTDITVQADVTLNQDDNHGYFLNVVLTATLPELDDAAAQERVDAAHQVCPYSKATRGNIDVKINAHGKSAKAA